MVVGQSLTGFMTAFLRILPCTFAHRTHLGNIGQGHSRLSINTQYSSRPIDHSECSLTLRPHHPFLTQILGVNILCISMRSLTGKIRAVSDVNYPANTQYWLTHPRHRSLIKMRIVVTQIISGRTHETLKLSAWVIINI